MSLLNSLNFNLTFRDGQNVLAFEPAPSFAEARFFMKGPLMDGTEGRPSLIRERLAPFGVGRFPLIAPKQVHGVHVLDSEKADALPSQPEADGILLRSFDMEASLRFGDCAPVLVLPREERARRNHPWALLLHSGYKGTVQNIVRHGLEMAARVMGDDGAVTSASAWVGPCVAGRNYPRTFEEWTERGLEIFHPENVREADGHFYFDLAGELKRQLLDCGLDERKIFLSGLDTVSNPETCYSFRRGDRGDRMFLHVRLLH